MNEIQELLAKLLLLQKDETRDLTELASRIKTSMDAGSVLDFRARCSNVAFLLASNKIPCQSSNEKESWLSQCNYIIEACDQSLQALSQETVVEWLQSHYFMKNQNK